ncbi:MAG: hypothetical protein AAGF83_21295 [Cyanobacteria bacterium P01_G01_bin.67]
MIIDGTPENDNLIGTAENDSITGAGGDDTLNGGLGDDTLLGGSGNDLISFDAGEKIVDGEAGDDVVVLDFSDESEDFSLIYNGGNVGITNQGPLDGTRISGIESLNITSGAGDDDINIAGATLASRVSTGEGRDMVIGGRGDDEIIAGAGDDMISAGLGDDSIFGGLGNDILNGQTGDDYFNFGAGSKTVNGGGGSDRIELDFSTESEDFVLTYNLFETASLTEGGALDGTEIEGIEQIDVISGSGDDAIDIAVTSIGGSITSGEGDDSLVGGSGDDMLDGESGDDTFFGGAGDDEIIGGAGNDASVYVGLRSDYEVVIDDGAATVTGVAIESLPEEDADITEAELFTDSLTDVEIILFDDGEIVVETGEFISFEDDSTDDGLDVPIDGEIEANIDSDDDVEVYEFFRTDTQTQFYTTDEDERDFILENLPQYELEGVSFVGVAPPEDGEDITGLSPVYRLFNTISGVHLYTVDEGEKTFIEENLDNYVLEGTPYYSYDAPEEGTVPVYRFYNPTLDGHFYTTSTEEKDFFTESPDYQIEGGSEGIAFYVEPASES